MKLIIFIAVATLFSYPTLSLAANKPAVKAASKPATAHKSEPGVVPLQLKEFDLARNIVDALGFGEGLPEKPTDKDYLQILGGNRTFKFEAENTFDVKSDPVTVRDYPLYGPFSGKGWLHGTTTEVAVHFTVFIPITGDYTLKVTAKGDNQLWSVAGKAFKLSSGNAFRESALGTVFIPAGVLEFNVVIPPGGAIDSFTFSAPSYVAVEPLGGWNPAQPLTAAPLNEAVSALLGLDPLLPVDSSFKPLVIEAASLPALSGRVHVTDDQIYGKPVAAKWVRAYQAVATVTIPLDIESTSVYTVRGRALGTTLSAGFGERKVTVAGKAYLDWIDFGTFRLSKGLNTLEIQLPPSGGVDVIEVTKKLASPAEFAAITKTGLQGTTPLKPAELDAVIQSLKVQFKERK